jgi:hypothetical protein
MKILQSIKEAVATEPPPHHDEWANLAGALGEAIMQRALMMPHAELRAFIADTDAGKRIANVGDRAFASAACIVGTALL